MKIGAFAQLVQAPKDTVRYYTGLGLLAPKQQGSQMSFSEREVEDFRYIQRLKEMRFSIREMQTFLYLRRMSNLIEPSTLDKYQEILLQKKAELEAEKRSLGESIAEIEEELRSSEAKRNVVKKGTDGVPLGAITILSCPHCHQQLEIENANIRGTYIYRGVLKCSCGYQARIEDGIVKTGNIYEGAFDTPDLKRKLYHESGAEWTRYSQKCTDFLLEELEGRELEGKVILESNVNGFFFIYNFLTELPSDCTYVIVDKYEEVLYMYKDLIETLRKDLDIIYIADASEHYPLRKKSVDLYLSFFGENEYSFYHTHTQLEDLKELLSDNGEVIGTFQSLPVSSKSRYKLMEKYPEGSDRRVNMEYLKQDYEKAGFYVEDREVGIVKKTENHHMYTCHVDGEPLTLCCYSARRIGKR